VDTICSTEDYNKLLQSKKTEKKKENKVEESLKSFESVMVHENIIDVLQSFIYNLRLLPYAFYKACALIVIHDKNLDGKKDLEPTQEEIIKKCTDIWNEIVKEFNHPDEKNDKSTPRKK